MVVLSMLGTVTNAQAANGEFWEITCISNDQSDIKVKALGNNGKIYDVKAVKESDNGLLNIIALDKVELKKNTPHLFKDYYQQANQEYETNLNLTIKGVTSTGEILEVKALPTTKNNYEAACVNEAGQRFSLRATAPHIMILKELRKI